MFWILQKCDFSMQSESGVWGTIFLRFFDRNLLDMKKFRSFLMEVGLMRRRASNMCLMKGCITRVDK